ncbi:MAG: 3'-5' exonuclease [Bacteroidetes bacterium]|nr:3'-5' exonuclease [Bacteroidota bacterium]
MSNQQTTINFSSDASDDTKGNAGLQLQKPLVFIDLETTGVNITADRIIEIAMVKVKPDGTKEVKRKLINPEMPIPEAAIAVHGITNEMVKDAPTFKQLANEIAQFIQGCDLSGYNSNRFDIPMLAESFLRVGIDWNPGASRLVDVQKIFHQMEQRTLSAAYKFYCNKILEGAHSAEVDASATWEILQAQLTRYPQLGNTVDTVLAVIGEEKIVDYARRMVFENGIEVFNFGKYKGRSVEEVLKAEPQYYDWMMKGDFALHTKQKLTEILNRALLKKK